MTGAVIGAVDAGAKVTGIGDENKTKGSSTKSASSISKNKAPISNEKSAPAKKKKDR